MSSLLKKYSWREAPPRVSDLLVSNQQNIAGWKPADLTHEVKPRVSQHILTTTLEITLSDGFVKTVLNKPLNS